QIDLTGSGDNTLVLRAADVRDLGGLNTFNDGNGWSGLGAAVPRHQLVVQGDAGDVLSAEGQWMERGAITVGGQAYRVYDDRAGAQLIVDEDVTRNFTVEAASWSLTVSGGGSVNSAGDVNGDGLADLIAATGTGRSYVVFGRSGTAAVELSAPGAGSAMVINASGAGDCSIAKAGDVNGDGLGDVIVSTGAGNAYVVFGRSGAAPVELSAVAAGDGGFAISGQSAGELAGAGVAAVGDVNGDGLGDVLLGTRTGRSYVVFGRSSRAPWDLLAVAAGSGGFTVNGQGEGEVSIGSVGDVNGDGLADLAVGTAGGRAYVVYGRSGTARVELSALGAGGLAINGTDVVNVSGAGDVNGDGLADLIVGGNAGRSYVVFGRSGAAAVELSALSGGSGGLVINGQSSGDLSISSVAGVGDVNGDGLADMLVGTQAGRAYVVFGRGDAGTVELSSAAAQGQVGFMVPGGSGSEGVSVSAAGDVNGDGLADLLVNSGGRSYVMVGGMGGAFVQTAAGVPVAGAGDDTLTATATSVLYGGAGNDRFVIDGTLASALQLPLGAGGNLGQLARIDGGAGVDSIVLAGSGITLDLTRVVNLGGGASRIEGVEKIDLTGSGNNTLTLAAADVSDLGGLNSFNAGNGWSWLGSTVPRHQLLVDGNAGDVLNATGIWVDRGALSVGTQTYEVYDERAGAAQLLVDKRITRNLSAVQPSVELSAVAAGSGGFVINGQGGGDYSGYSVSNAGDVNGDGLADLIVGALLSDVAGRTDAGRSYVVFGRSGAQAVELSAVA
ncbi:beta strand repeat-containing protein, partial [Azohydromonas lata]|uniref:beta strand repeat-containing protein n=1 Tax=Azohydromonas lata TaxID=45677 RepID=UPI0014723043